MSIRAHKVIEVKTDKDVSFSLSDKLVDFLDVVNMDSLDCDCCGLCMASVAGLEKIIKTMPKEDRVHYTKLIKDIAIAKKNGETEIEYYLY